MYVGNYERDGLHYVVNYIVGPFSRPGRGGGTGPRAEGGWLLLLLFNFSYEVTNYPAYLTMYIVS